MSPPSADALILRTTLTSPFGRKVRMAADVLGLDDRVDIVHADTADEHDTLHQQNPLGKIPCLVREDGTAIFDSGVIVEFLQDIAGTQRLLPLSGPGRFRMLTQTRLADGMMDAGALIIYEARFHDESDCSPRWLAHQRGKILRALATFEREPPDPAITDAVTIGLACALGFLDKRKPVEWRADFPRLVSWLDAFVAREAAFGRTRAPDT